MADTNATAEPPNMAAGLTFPIGKTATLLKDHASGVNGLQFTDQAAVFLAASLEYLAAEFTELSAIEAIEEHTKIIQYSAARNNEELSELLQKLKIEINNIEVEQVYGEDEEYDYNSHEDDVDEIPSDIVQEYDDTDTVTYTNTKDDSVEDLECDIAEEYDVDKTHTDEEDVTNASVAHEERESVVVGQMSIAADHMELYRRLIDKFGEIVSPNLPKYKVAPTCVALRGLLELVETMVEITPEEISQEMVSDWEGTVSFYGEMGLKLGWLEDRVCRYGDWFVKRSGVDVNQLRVRVAAKQEELEEKRKEVSALESELQDLSVELETAHLSQSQFGFSFYDE